MKPKDLIAFFLIILGISFSLESKAQNRLYPTGRDNSQSTLNQYKAKRDSLLLNNRELGDFAFTISPSFYGNTGCYYDKSKSEIVLNVSNENIWYFYNGEHTTPEEKKAGVKITEYRCPVSRETAREIKKLFFAAVFTSSYFAAPVGLDGTTYELLYYHGVYTAEFWSPEKGTNCHRLEKILKTIATAVRENKQEDIDNLAPEIEALTKEFEKLFPEEAKEKKLYFPL